LLFIHIIRIIREFGRAKPKILLLENVKNLKSHDRGRTFKRIQSEIQRAGYWFTEADTKILHTADYTDIPQNRERIFMVAMSCDHFPSNSFVFPSPLPQRKLRPVMEFLDMGYKAADYYYFKPENRYYPLFKKAIKEGGKDAIYQLRRNYVRRNMSGMCFTLMANMGDGGHNQPVVKDRWGIRKLLSVPGLSRFLPDDESPEDLFDGGEDQTKESLERSRLAEKIQGRKLDPRHASIQGESTPGEGDEEVEGVGGERNGGTGGGRGAKGGQGKGGSHGDESKPSIPIRYRTFATNVDAGIYSITVQSEQKTPKLATLAIWIVGDDAKAPAEIHSARLRDGKALPTKGTGVIGPLTLPNNKGTLHFEVSLREPMRLAMEVAAHEAE
jgi:site-specific DNA-cytosine methylase